MPHNFIGCDHEQSFLMPPSLQDWVPEDHLVWTVLEAVEAMDLAAFYAVYRADGHGRPAYEPSMMAWSPCCFTPMRAGTLRRGGLNGIAVRMLPTG